MRRVSFDEYRAAPLDCWTGGEGWLHFCATRPYLSGGIAWGTFEPNVAQAMLACATSASRSLPREHSALMDGRRTLVIESLSFRLVSDYVGQREAAVDRVARMAGIRPIGIMGVVAEGFLRMVPPGCPLQLFSERGEGLDWLRCEAHASAIEDIESLARTVGEDTRSFDEFRRVVEANILDGSIDVVARRLAMSTRSLQRRLRAQGTSFQRELNAARVRIAQRLLLESDASLAQVASEAGFGSASTMGVVFRRHEGMTPGEWRKSRGLRADD